MAIVLTVFAVPSGGAKAQPTLHDTNEIRKRTPEQARPLATDLQGGGVRLRSLPPLDAATAEAISRY